MRPEFDHLLKAEDLLRGRMKNLVMLGLLHHGKCTRFSELKRGIFEHTNRYPNESRLTKALNQLLEAGLVRKEMTDKDMPLWALSERGQEQAQLLNEFVRNLADTCDDQRTTDDLGILGGGVPGQAQAPD